MRWRHSAVLAVVGALGIALTGLGTNANAVQALGWAATAGVGLSAMLRGAGLRVMGLLGVVLAIAAGASAAAAGGWAWLAVAFAAALAVAAFSTFRHARRWRGGAATRREPVTDLWKQFDAGDDPTTNEPTPGEHRS